MKWLAPFTAKTIALSAALGISTELVHAQAWPAHPVTIVVTFGAGGTADTLGRIIAAELEKEFKQQFYIENRPGSSGSIGSTFAAGANWKPQTDGEWKKRPSSEALMLILMIVT